MAVLTKTRLLLKDIVIKAITRLFLVFIHKMEYYTYTGMFTLLVIMEFNFHIKMKLLFSCMHYGYIDKHASGKRKQCHENYQQAEFVHNK